MSVPNSESIDVKPRLSICIATYNRGQYIGETLDSIIALLVPGVEIIVVDGASTDKTADIMAGYVSRSSQIRYFRESQNSGVDGDYDKAVGYAKGGYCWLMTDDDLLKPDAIKSVLEAITGEFDLIVVNSEVRDTNFKELVVERKLAFNSDRIYEIDGNNKFFEEVAIYLSFIGCVVVQREIWLARERKSFYGTLFIHMGVIFQEPLLDKVKVIAEPLIIIRYGNAMWTPRSFEIWMFKWPELIWSFSGFPDDVKQKICSREPWRSSKRLLNYRATGAYTFDVFKKFIAPRTQGLHFVSAFVVSIFPASLANMLAIMYIALSNKDAGLVLYDLLHTKHTTRISHFLAKFVKLNL